MRRTARSARKQTAHFAGNKNRLRVSEEIKMTILERIQKERIFFDGGTGTILQSLGLKPGELPETWNLSHPDEVRTLYTSYLKAGSHVFNTNTFGANRLKYPDNLAEIVEKGVRLAKEAQIGRAHV